MCASGIEAGIYHDLGSGSNVDYLVITKGNVRVQRSYKSDNKKPANFTDPARFAFPPGTTEVLDTKRIPLDVSEGPQPMEL